DFPDEEDAILNLSARWNANERKRLEGLLSEADFQVESNVVTKAFLRLLDEKTLELEAALATAKKQGEPITQEEITLPDYEGKVVIVINYAQEDQVLWQELKKHFFLFYRDQDLQFVDIHNDVPLGVSDTFSYQEKLIAAADRVLSLVTPNIMAYPAFMLAEQALAHSKLIPIRLEQVAIEDSPFHLAIRGLPADSRFVSEWSNKNAALADIAKHLRPVFNKLKTDLNS
ncbi:MAG: hypothetical protein AAGJ93_07200, partial [Bacteroidota bacterium]